MSDYCIFFNIASQALKMKKLIQIILQLFQITSPAVKTKIKNLFIKIGNQAVL